MFYSTLSFMYYSSALRICSKNKSSKKFLLKGKNFFSSQAVRSKPGGMHTMLATTSCGRVLWIDSLNSYAPAPSNSLTLVLLTPNLAHLSPLSPLKRKTPQFFLLLLPSKYLFYLFTCCRQSYPPFHIVCQINPFLKKPLQIITFSYEN